MTSCDLKTTDKMGIRQVGDFHVQEDEATKLGHLIFKESLRSAFEKFKCVGLCTRI